MVMQRQHQLLVKGSVTNHYVTGKKVCTNYMQRARNVIGKSTILVNQPIRNIMIAGIEPNQGPEVEVWI